MSSTLHNFALAWNSGLRFFLDSPYSPLPEVLYPPLEPDIQRSQNGVPYPSRLLSYAPPGLSLPRGTALSERSNQRDFWLWLWLWTSRTTSIHVVTPSLLSVLDRVLPSRGFYEPRRPHRFQRDLASYPLDWSVAELAHQHFLALASLSLWHVEIRGCMNWQIQVCWLRTSFSRFLPEPLDVCLDKMCLWFQDRLRAWRKVKDSNRGIAETRRSLFFYVVCTLLLRNFQSNIGLPGGYGKCPPLSEPSWRSGVLVSSLRETHAPSTSGSIGACPSPGASRRTGTSSSPSPLCVVPPGCYGMTPLDRMGVASLRISDLDPRRLSDVSTSFSSEGILEFLDVTASSGFVAEGGISAHILLGADLDAFIAEHRWNPDKFLDLTPSSALSVPHVLRQKVPTSFSARLPEPDTYQALQSCTADPSRPQGAIIRTLYPLCRRCAAADQLCVLDFPPSDPLPSRTPRCCHPCQRRHASCDMVAGLSAAFEARDEDWLSLFRVEFWEHLGEGIFQPLLLDPRCTDLPLLGVVASPLYSDPDSPLSLFLARTYSFREFLSWFQPVQGFSRAFVCRSCQSLSEDREEGPSSAKRTRRNSWSSGEAQEK
ncbi:hypothetical protein K438DRAFT_1984303 [Mycena galopus ATCC 62051]|nr:hypothetical protein K438DRAFT_1984303 [Mycena galopus ATCC 62051]